MHEYFRQQLKYERRYGPKTVVLTEVGAFYELYAIDLSMIPSEWWAEENLIPDHLRKEFNEISNYYPIHSEGAIHPPNPNNYIALPKLGKVHEIEHIINCRAHLRNSTSDYSLSNCWTSGFNMVGSEAKIDLLKWNGYSVAIFDQSDDELEGTKRLKRELVTVARHQIDSHIATEITRKIVVIYLQCFKTNAPLEQIEVLSGVAHFDLETGENGISEMYSRKDDPLKGLQELYRYLIGLRPKEIYIHIKGIPQKLEASYTDFIARYLELYNFPFARCIYNQIPNSYLKIPSQNDLLSDLFFPAVRITTSSHVQQTATQPQLINLDMSTLTMPTLKTTTSVKANDSVSRLGLESFPNGIVSYLMLLDYCRDIDPDLIVSLSKPKADWIDADDKLILTHNAIAQLDIFDFGGHISSGATPHLETAKPLVEVIDQTCTPMGKRFLYSRLIAPSSSSSELNRLYDMTDSLISNASALKAIRSELRSIGDLSKLKRKLNSSKLHPRELALVLRACTHISSLFNLIETAALTPLLSRAPVKERSEMMTALHYVLANISIDALRTGEISFLNEKRADKALLLPFDKIGRPSILANPEAPSSDYFRSFAIYESNISVLRGRIDSLLVELRSQAASIKTTARKSNESIDLKIKSSKTRRGYSDEFEIIVKPKSKATGLEKLFSSLSSQQPLLKDAHFIHRSSGSVLTSTALEKTIELLQSQLNSYFLLLHSLYKHLTEVVTTKDWLDPIIDFVTELDFVCSSAYNAIEHKYSRPEIVGGDVKEPVSTGSYFEAREMRHPIVERSRLSKFIPNDISLGRGIASRSLEGDVRTLGSPYCACVRGPNTAGKTTLTKTVALLILLAQAGYFVPSKLVFRPYKQIITRLSGNDNLRQGLSSFEVEMMELRIILKGANQNTLVLGDELCRGTEVFTAVSITIGAIQELARRECSFIFSTHLYDLDTYPDIAAMETGQLQFYHLTSHYDSVTSLLVQDRILKEGIGPVKYGIDVARAKGLPTEFMDSVNRISKVVEARILSRDEESTPISPSTTSLPSRYRSDLLMSCCSVCGATENLETHHREEQAKADPKGFIGTMHKNTRSNLDVLCQDCHGKITRGQSTISNLVAGGHTIVSYTETISEST